VVDSSDEEGDDNKDADADDDDIDDKDAYSIDGTRNGVEDEEADLYCQCNDDDRSTTKIIAGTSEEHDDTNKEEAPSTSFEESQTKKQ
jgi:hypothetical protein